MPQSVDPPAIMNAASPLSFTTMRQIDSTAQSIDALIQTGALDAARDLLRAELGALSTHVGALQVEAWCTALGLTQLLELPKAIAAAHVTRETHGTAAIAEFVAIAQTAHAQGDEVGEFRALAGVFCTGLQVWNGFGEMQRAALRMNELHAFLHDRLSRDVAIECLSGLMVARMLFAGDAADAAVIGEVLVTLTLDARVVPEKRLCAAMVLAPWFEQTRDGGRMHRIADEMRPLVSDTTIPLITRLNYRTSIALTDVNLNAGHGNRAPENALLDQLIAETTVLDVHHEVPQWLRFYVHRVALQAALLSNDQQRSAHLFGQLEALVNPADASQLLRLHFIRVSRALRLREFSVAYAQSQRCMELAQSLHMPKPITLVYESGVANALLGLRRLSEAQAIYVSIIAASIPGHRIHYERNCALIDAAVALDIYHAQNSGETMSASGTATNREASDILRAALADYLRHCGGRLPPAHAKIFPHVAQPVIAAIFAHGLGTEVLAEDIRAQAVQPPKAHPVSWPWRLRIRLFDGFSLEGVAASAQDAGKKGDSKSMQILQYLAAHAPGAVASQRLADALWPEAEGDKAMRSLDVALTRLRQALPDASLLVRRDGKIGFDMDRVWCDTHAVLAMVDELRSDAGAGRTGNPTAEGARQNARDANTTLALLDLYRGPLLPDSREAFARDRSAFFRSQVAGAVQIGLRAAINLPDQTIAEEIVRKSVAHGLPADVVRSVVTDLQARGADTSRRAAQLNQVFELARA